MTAKHEVDLPKSAALRVAVLDLGIGNPRSVMGALERIGVLGTLLSDPARLHDFDRAILPGVGAHDALMDAMVRVGFEHELRHYVNDPTRRFLGICIGMHILFEESEEGTQPGLGVLPGRIRRLRDSSGLPHINIGWSVVEHAKAPRTSEMDWGPFYFVHEYASDDIASDAVLLRADTRVGAIVAAVRVGNVWGTQFHPERSSREGRNFLRAFLLDGDE